MILETKYPEFKNLTYSKWVKYAVFLLLISFFYNLPVMNYRVTGNNEWNKVMCNLEYKLIKLCVSENRFVEIMKKSI